MQQHQFAHYPKVMKHPHHRPAQISGPVKDERGRVVGQQPPGTPEKFPEVTVHNKDQELQHASMGYRPAGVSDEAAYMTSVLGADKPGGYGFNEFPKYLYKLTGDGEIESKLVNDAAEEKALGAGWAKNPDAAREAAKKPAKTVKTAAAEPKEPETTDTTRPAVAAGETKPKFENAPPASTKPKEKAKKKPKKKAKRKAAKTSKPDRADAPPPPQ